MSNVFDLYSHRRSSSRVHKPQFLLTSLLTFHFHFLFEGSRFSVIGTKPSTTAIMKMLPTHCRLLIALAVAISTFSNNSCSALGPAFIISSAISRVDVFFKTHRFATAFIAGGAQATAADFAAQSRERLQNNNTEDCDFCHRRNLSFLLYGGLYQGMANEFIFNTLLPFWFGTNHMLQALVAVFFFGSMVSLPIAYRIKAFVFGYSGKEGFRRYRHDVTHNGLLKKFWIVWIPVNCTNFGIVPPRYRITVNSIVAFCWLTVLSTISSRHSSSEDVEIE
jgi:hypothetical protein